MGNDIVVKTHNNEITDEELEKEFNRIERQKRLTKWFLVHKSWHFFLFIIIIRELKRCGGVYNEKNLSTK